jgi:hypothetical protein
VVPLIWSRVRDVQINPVVASAHRETSSTTNRERR